MVTLRRSKGCTCTALCSMGPTCPGGMLARLPGSGCGRQPCDRAPKGWHCNRPLGHTGPCPLYRDTPWWEKPLTDALVALVAVGWRIEQRLKRHRKA